MAKMVRVQVSVPKREGFPGFWSAKKFLPNGNSELMVTEDEAAELQKDAADLGMFAVAVLPDAKPAPAK